MGQVDSLKKKMGHFPEIPYENTCFVSSAASPQCHRSVIRRDEMIAKLKHGFTAKTLFLMKSMYQHILIFNHDYLD